MHTRMFEDSHEPLIVVDSGALVELLILSPKGPGHWLRQIHRIFSIGYQVCDATKVQAFQKFSHDLFLVRLSIVADSHAGCIHGTTVPRLRVGIAMTVYSSPRAF